MQQGQTLLNICQQMSQQMDQMALIIQALTGKDMGVAGGAQTGGSTQGGTTPSEGTESGGSGLASAVMQAQTPMTDYGTRLAKRSTPDMNSRSSSAAPQ